ncbi:MAG: ParB/RepB/Spo0J family partition protein [Gammaproteobacteria bacterium]|nr:ParB/RepB/Spo0J family partition protein [Gammaproteobacteria bacterium]
MDVQEVALSSLRIDGGTQPREQLEQSMVDHYQECMKAGDEFPPVVIFHDGSHYWLADGFHRLFAARGLGKDSIKGDIRQGTQREAVLFSCGANAHHGVRRNAKDKRRAVMILLCDETWGKWSHNKLAQIAQVSQPFVSQLASELEEAGIKKKNQNAIYEKAGKEREMNTENIGKSYPVKKEEEDEEELPEEEAQEETLEEIKEKVDSTSSEPEEEDWRVLANSVFAGLDVSDKLSIYRSTAVSVEMLAYAEGMGLGELSEYAVVTRRLLQEVMKLDWVKTMDVADVKDITKIARLVRRWGDGAGALSLETPKAIARTKPKKSYLATDEAKECWALWKKLIGTPNNPKPDSYYWQAFDDLHEGTAKRMGYDWGFIKEVIHGAKICWIDKGIPIVSPATLKEPTKSGDSIKLEAIITSYRSHPDYEPLREIPACPECGEELEKQDFKHEGKVWNGYICRKHPRETMGIGDDFIPKRYVRTAK